ncbi:MAG: elongation factor P [Patescibacteria group bacterium]
MASPNDIKKSTVINLDGTLWIVVDFQRVSPGKGSSFVRTRLRNLKTGKVQEQAFKSAESLTFEDVVYKKMSFLFSDANSYTFMDNQTYEQLAMDRDQIGDEAKYLKEGLEVSVVTHHEIPLALQIPKKIEYTIVNADPAVKGDTASGNVLKEATLDNGLVTRVPIFIKQGDRIVVNTDEGAYVERVS